MFIQQLPRTSRARLAQETLTEYQEVVIPADEIVEVLRQDPEHGTTTIFWAGVAHTIDENTIVQNID